MFNSIAPVKRAASSAPHAVVADHNFMAASVCGCIRMCMRMREQQCRALPACSYACIQSHPRERERVCQGNPKVRFGLSMLYPDPVRPTSSARSAAAGGGRASSSSSDRIQRIRCLAGGWPGPVDVQLIAMSQESILQDCARRRGGRGG